jgi:hypothetical protein
MVTTIAILAICLTSSAYADEPSPAVNIYAWTDKTSYNPGEKGVLKIVIRNNRTDVDLILKNITITYPWFAYTGEKWEGNATLKPDVALTKNGGVYTTNVEFDIPMDGRVTSGTYGISEISIRIAVDKSPYYYPTSPTGYQEVPIYIKSTPAYMSLEDAEKIITLFTIQVVLIIVCTIIIAATIFLSVRRPQVTWRTEEKAE